MKRKCMMMGRPGLATLGLSMLMMSSAPVGAGPAQPAEPDDVGHLTKQTCEIQATEKKLTGPDKDSFIAKCEEISADEVKRQGTPMGDYPVPNPDAPRPAR